MNSTIDCNVQCLNFLKSGSSNNWTLRFRASTVWECMQDHTGDIECDWVWSIYVKIRVVKKVHQAGRESNFFPNFQIIHKNLSFQRNKRNKRTVKVNKVNWFIVLPTTIYLILQWRSAQIRPNSNNYQPKHLNNKNISDLCSHSNYCTNGAVLTYIKWMFWSKII